MTHAHPIDQALARMRDKRALLVGDFMLDAYVFGETERVSREAPVLVVRQEYEEVRAGAAANTAANLAALHLQVEAVGWLGDDDPGHALRSLLSKTGCDLRSLVVSNALATPVKTRVLAGAFGTTRQQVLRLDTGTQPRVPADVQQAMADAIRARGLQADVVVVSDYGLGSMGPMVRDALATLVQQGIPVCVDSRLHLRDYVGMTAVTPNMPEAEAFVGGSLTTPEEVERAAAHIVRSLRCEACLLTQGKGGMTLATQAGQAEHIDVVGDSEVTDVTGAGDTVIATLAASLAAGVALSTGMRLANCAAGIVVTRQGAATASPTEIASRAHAASVAIHWKDGACAHPSSV